jgi:hypothetical protein
MEKEKRIEELIAQIAEAKTRTVHTNSEFLKSLHPEMTNEEALIGGEMLLNTVLESAKKSQALMDSLDSCQTMEEIDAWRQANNF